MRLHIRGCLNIIYQLVYPVKQTQFYRYLQPQTWLLDRSRTRGKSKMYDCSSHFSAISKRNLYLSLDWLIGMLLQDQHVLFSKMYNSVWTVSIVNNAFTHVLWNCNSELILEYQTVVLLIKDQQGVLHPSQMCLLFCP